MRIRTKKMPSKILDVGPQELAALEHWGLVLEYVDDASGEENPVLDVEAAEAENTAESPETVLTLEEWKKLFKSSSG